MKKRKVSVVIPTYNYGCFLAEAITSVLSQTYPIHEVVIVDDGSTDQTQQVVDDFGDRVTYFKQENSGLSAARNSGILQTSGDLIAFLDSDDVWYPQKIEKQIRLLEQDDEIGMVFSCVREFDSNTGDTIQVYCEGKEDWVADDLLLFGGPVVIAIGSTGLIRRDVIDLVGGFDTDLKHSEDWDLAYRVARKFRLRFVHEVLVDYRNHGRNMHKNVSVMETSMKRCFEKSFETDDERILRLRKRAYGNLYRVLAGSYFTAGNYYDFMRATVKCLTVSPRSIAYFARFPCRRLNSMRKKTG